MTDKKTTKIDKQTEDWRKKLLKNPALILALAGVFGISGDQVQAVLQADIPGWAAAVLAGALPLAYVVVRWGRSQLDTNREMVSTVKLLRVDVGEVKQALSEGADKFKQHSDMLRDHGERLNEAEAWIAAHQEQTRRDTGKLK